MAKETNKTDCIFCKIASGEVKAVIRYEDDEIIAFDDLYPDAPVHVLVIPKKHIDSLADVEKLDKDLLGRLMLVCKEVASIMNIDENGYRVIANVRKWGGQVIPHLHFHVLGGAPLPTKVGLSVEEELPHPKTRKAIS